MRWIPVIDTNQHGLYNAYFSKVAASLDAYEFITYGNDQILDTERFEMMSNDNLGIQSSLFVNNAEETIAY